MEEVALIASTEGKCLEPGTSTSLVLSPTTEPEGLSIRANEVFPKNSGHCRVGHWRIPFPFNSLQNRMEFQHALPLLCCLSINMLSIFKFGHPACLPMLLSTGKILSNENSDSTASTPFTRIAGLNRVFASYNILALWVSFLLWITVGSERRKPLLLSRPSQIFTTK